MIAERAFRFATALSFALDALHAADQVDRDHGEEVDRCPSHAPLRRTP